MIHIHWHRFHHQAGVNTYGQCRCGSRCVTARGRYGASPIDATWLRTGESTREPSTGPARKPPPDTSWITFDSIPGGL